MTLRMYIDYGSVTAMARRILIPAAVLPALVAAIIPAAAPAQAGPAAAASPVTIRCAVTGPRAIRCRAVGVATATWSFGDGRSVSSSVAVVRYRRTGGYYLRLRATTAAGEQVVRVVFVLVTRTGTSVRIR